MRDNFYDWKISVNSEFEILAEFLNIFREDKKISSCYCEGFENEWIYNSYSENKKQFTIEISSNEFLFMFFWIIKEYMNKTLDKG